MVRASHVIFSAYGFWLPNDPRGSWSEFVGAWELLRFGRATKVTTRRSLAGCPHDARLRLAAKEALKYPPVRFTGIQARAIGRGLASGEGKANMRMLACSIMPEHVHLVIARHAHDVERLVNFLKGEATRQLCLEGIHPLAGLAGPDRSPPKAWGRGLWKVFLDSHVDVRRAIRYVEENPGKEGKPRQRWGFVTPYEGSGEWEE